jgi:hemoglobin
MSESGETLYDRLGGRDAVDAVVDEFYDRVLADESLAPFFEGTEMDELRAHQAAFISAVTGGPDDYEGATMREAHAHLDLSEREFAAVAGHLDDALAAFDVSESDREAVLAEVAELESAILDR